MCVAYVKFYPKNVSQAGRIHVGTATLAVVLSLSLIAIPFVTTFFRSLSKQKNEFHEEKLNRARSILESISSSSESNI